MYKLDKSIETGKPGPNPAYLTYLVHEGLSHGATWVSCLLTLIRPDTLTNKSDPKHILVQCDTTCNMFYNN